MVVPREISTKVLLTGTDVAADTEISETIGETGDGFAYHIKSLYLPVEVDTGATGMAFQITDADDNVVWSGHTLTDVATGSASFQAQRVENGFTDGDGSEIIVLPDKLIVPGGFKIKTVTDTVGNVDYGSLVVFGAQFKGI